ncbi:MAG: FtsX-like permease family protein [Planctomycetes bacterium]|nr:FtsX-like permease family protein [Planctomycetota bacterium]MCH8121300.1 FtsX-like permease family protein [Planctomycetota bacterium]
MLKIFLWLRYLRKKKIVFLSIAAVALSVSLLIVVASLFTGFINAFERAAVEAIGDVVLEPSAKFAKYGQFIERLEQTEAVEAATAMLKAHGLLHLGKGNVRAVEIWGIEPERRVKVMGFDRFLLRQRTSGGKPSFDIKGPENNLGGFVGIGVLAEPDEKTDKYDFDAIEKMFGKKVLLTTGTVSQADPDSRTRAEVKRRVIRFTIADVVETGVYQFDKGCVYLPIEKLWKYLYPEDELPVASQIQIKLAEDTEADVALAVIRGVWRSFVEEQLGGDLYLINANIVTAKQIQRPYVAAYRKQMWILLLIFGVVSLGVVLLIFCIFYMIVRLKQKDIAIIKSCGASGSSVAWIFVGFGACVGIAGSGVGVVLGYVITKNVNTIEEWIRIIFGLKLWKSSVYMFSKIPNEVDWASALSIVLVAIIAAAIGTLIPAIVAARTKPVEILRYE